MGMALLFYPHYTGESLPPAWNVQKLTAWLGSGWALFAKKNEFVHKKIVTKHTYMWYICGTCTYVQTITSRYTNTHTHIHNHTYMPRYIHQPSCNSIAKPAWLSALIACRIGIFLTRPLSIWCSSGELHERKVPLCIRRAKVVASAHLDAKQGDRIVV